jgi:protein-L-isoaspartate(D-aspartate) O-methyltransferase
MVESGRSAEARTAMVEALAATGAVETSSVLAAMGRVPRERFVPRFWALSPPFRGSVSTVMREWHVGPAEDALELVYDIDRALVIRREPDAQGPVPAVTSTVYAPRIVGSMLELLDLRPGMSVLEIGAGSGYNAALLRELVGPSGSVTSVDIDAGLVAETAERMIASGYGDVHIAAADGHFGLASRAPFDRIVATVGCTDLAPAWLEQLAEGGFCLLPLEHGGWHPLTRIEPIEAGNTGVVVGRSGFVRIQGHQAGASWWPTGGQFDPSQPMQWSALPDDLAIELRAEPGREAVGGRRMWDLAFLLALEDRRSAFVLTLADAASSATIDPIGKRIGWTGTHGSALRLRILELAERWVDMGRPSIHDYTSTFRLLAERASAEEAPEPSRWTIDRLDFRQTVLLEG